ncbi:uncharacterized protein LOC129233148 isoform X2 [Uloborus diversus]|nr:uncharacterized protein LOC129233148 isoform X2 [Uloborus diversus]
MDLKKPYKQYMVAEFEDGLEVVPTKWRTSKNHCLFPNTTSANRMTKAAKNLEDPKESWATYRMKKIYAYSNSYAGALRKMEVGCYQSDGFSSTENENGRDETDYEEVDEIKNYPQVPSLRGEEDSVPENLTEESFRQQLDQPEPVAAEKSVTATELKEILRCTTINKFKIDTVQDRQLEILTKLDLILNKIGEQGKENVPVPAAPDLPCFPISSEEDVLILEEKLSEEEVRKHMIRELQKFGGAHLAEVVRRMLVYLLTDEVAEKYSFMGLKGKMQFSSLKLCSLINDVARIHVKTATNKEISKPIAAWLRHAKERLNKKKTQL